jgi:YD repeat-containing protein
MTNGTNIESLATQYRYNTLNQVIAQLTPDGGQTQFWYDRLGRLAVSQNAKQADSTAYSYTLYDALNRITEVGQKPQSTAMTQTISQDTTSLSSWLAGGSSAVEITRTVYDTPYVTMSGSSVPINGSNLTLGRNASSGGGTAPTAQLSYKYRYVNTSNGISEYVPGQAPTSGVSRLTNQLSSIQVTPTGTPQNPNELVSQSAFNY